MTKYIKSQEALPSCLHLWDPMPTQTAIMNSKVMEFSPISSIADSDTISFTIPPFPNYMLDSIEVITELRVIAGDGEFLAENVNVGTVPHLAASLWRNVDVSIDNTNLMQSIENSYVMFKFWDTVLHHGQASNALLKHKEGLILDHVTKAQSEDTTYFPVAVENVTPPVVNLQGKHRAHRIQRSRKVCLVSDLNVPIFKQSKLLPTNLKISVSLTKNFDGFVLMSAANGTEKLQFEKVVLRCLFHQPSDVVLSLIEERLATENAIYRSDRKIMSFHPLTTGAREVTLSNIFTGTLPYFFVMGVQDRTSFGRHRNKNCFTLYPIKKLQAYLNNQSVFASPVERTDHDYTNSYSTLIAESGMPNHGDTLLHNCYNSYPALACDLTRDKSLNSSSMNISQSGTVNLVIEFSEDLPANRVLMILAWYEQIVEISKNREITVI